MIWKKKRKKKIKCIHEWESLGKKEYCDPYDCWELEVLFCPHCQKREEFTIINANILLKQTEVNREYGKYNPRKDDSK